MIKLSDYVALRLAEFGVRHVFMVTGGGSMHLNDSLGRAIPFICNHHEQASAMAAEGYARITGEPAVVNVTTGPGGINALNGVFGAWTDSIPMLVISGQVKRETCMSSYPDLRVRQLGYQEVDIIRMVKGITKYSHLVDDPASIRYHLERAWFLAKSGRPGPCWLDIPVDVQAARIDERSLEAYDPREDQPKWDLPAIRRACVEIYERLQQARRPVILAGSGVRIAGAENIFECVSRALGIPVTTSRTANDLIASDDPLFCGRPGADNGDRPGNFAVQNSDLLLVLGSRLSVMQTGYNFKTFAREAFKVQVDIDGAELEKPTIRTDLGVHCDLRVFLEQMYGVLRSNSFDHCSYGGWLKWCRERVERYPVVLPRHRVFNGKVNPYHFIDQVFRRLHEDDVVICGNGAAFVITAQVAQIKKGQRLIFNSGCASMGHDLPAAIGAALARPGKRIVCFAGDGSLQMNIQELQTLKHHGLPVKLFVLNNGGYLSIRTTQKNFFSALIGEGPESGISFPDVVKVAEAYGLASSRIDYENFEAGVDRVLDSPGAAVCEVMLDPDQRFEPRASSRQTASGTMVSAPLEDLWPFLEREELRRNLLVRQLEE